MMAIMMRWLVVYAFLIIYKTFFLNCNYSSFFFRELIKKITFLTSIKFYFSNMILTKTKQKKKKNPNLI
jgi:hypothetical protein